MNISSNLTTIIGGRITGVKDNNNPGISYGGNFYPSTNGVSARFESFVMLNHGSRTDNQGQKVERESDTIKIVAWNGREAAPGKGFADICAKTLSTGKELSFFARIHSYKGRLYNSVGGLITNPDGTPLLITKTAFTLEAGSLRLGDDSQKLIDAEIHAWIERGLSPQTYRGELIWGVRPPQWNVRGTADADMWAHLSKLRMTAQAIPPATTYGYARIIVPGATQAPAQNQGWGAQFNGQQNNNQGWTPQGQHGTSGNNQGWAPQGQNNTQQNYSNQGWAPQGYQTNTNAGNGNVPF